MKEQMLMESQDKTVIMKKQLKALKEVNLAKIKENNR